MFNCSWARGGPAQSTLVTRFFHTNVVGGFALDILITLASRPGKLVTKRELLDQVWTGTTSGKPLCASTCLHYAGR
jgi:hypothetical protein